MDIWNVIAERKIQEAMEEGDFNHLEGTGRPLPEDDNPYEDPAQRMAHRLMKNAGITPDWIAEGREIDREAARLRTAPSADRQRAVAELNRRIALYNLKTPIATTHRRPIEE